MEKGESPLPPPPHHLLITHEVTFRLDPKASSLSSRRTGRTEVVTVEGLDASPIARPQRIVDAHTPGDRV